MQPYHKNPRKITADERRALAETLAELGDLSGIVHDLNSDEIIGGNQRSDVFDINDCEIEIVQKFDAPDRQGTIAHGFVVWQGARYAYRQVRWTPGQCEKANIVANKAGGDWDIEKLLADFERDGLLAWGFDDTELDRMAAELAAEQAAAKQQQPGDAEPQTNRAEELRKEWGVEPGQLWRLPSRTPGQEHRLICGDCTDVDVVAQVMGGERADMIFTDPPYNHASENSGFAASVSPSHSALMGSDWDKDFRFESIIPALESVIITDCTVYICTSWHLAGEIWAWMSKRSSHYSYCVWSKSNPMPSLAKRHWTWASEIICYATYGKHTFNFPSEGHAPNVWTFTKHKETDHPTEKPVEVPQHAIKHSSKQGDIVTDFFLGSGTTIIAAENLSRQCRAVEIAPGYVAVALQRYQDAFGITPELIR